jgi:hypothetical protein
MKKLFLPLVALVGAISANAVQYTQVTSLDDLTDGSTYVIEAYNHNWTQNRVLTFNGSSVTTEALSNSDIAGAGLTSSAIWTLEVVSGYDCVNPTDVNTTQYKHGSGKTVRISNNGLYPTWSWSGGTSMSTTSDGTGIGTLCEFFTIEARSGSDTSSSYFSLHVNWTTVPTTSQTSFITAWAVNSSGTIGSTSGGNNTPYWFGPCYDSNTTGYTSIFRIWKVETTIADKLQLLKDTYSAQCESLCTQFGITDSNYANDIEAVTATTEDELTTAEASLKQIVADVTSTICATYTGYFTIQHVEQSPTGANASRNEGWAPLYYVGLSDDNIPSTLGTDMAKSSIWKLEAVADENSTTGISVTIYNPIANLYICPTNQSVGSNQCISTSSDASNYYLIPKDITNDKFALFGSTGYLHVQNLSTCQSWPTDVATDAPAQSQWYLRKATEEQLAAVYALTDADVDAKKGGKVEGTKLGQYVFTPSFTEKETAYTTGKTADFGDAATAYRDITATEFTTALNMPAKNSYLRIKGADGYVTANQDIHETEATAASIIWYSGETMVDYANGYAFHAEGFCDDDDVTSEQNTAVNISFSEASNAVGTYIITPAEGDAYNSDGLTLEEVTALPVALNGGVAAVCFPVDVTLPSDGKFYTCVCDGTNITVSKKSAGDVIAAGTAILISGDADVELPYTAGESTATANSDNNISYNQLATKFTATDGTITYVPSAASAAKAPALRVADADGETVPSVTFAKITSGNLAANTPAINVSTSAVPSGTDPVETFSLTLDPEQTEDTFSVVSVVTSIEEINAEAAAQQPIYDLQGRRVTATPTHGLFIFGNKIRRI